MQSHRGGVRGEESRGRAVSRASGGSLQGVAAGVVVVEGVLVFLFLFLKNPSFLTKALGGAAHCRRVLFRVGAGDAVGDHGCVPPGYAFVHGGAALGIPIPPRRGPG